MRYPTILLIALLCGVSSLALAESSPLAGTAWRLVEIQSMDDQVYVPEEGAEYSLELRDDGMVAIRADCQLGTGTWASDAPGQLRFGAIATTRALCPPGSLSERYLAQFQWVRSYVIEDEHLFLATMADGSIIELAPLEPPAPVATLFGESLRDVDATQLQEIILGRLFEHYADEQGIVAEPDEIAALLERLRAGRAAAGLDADTRLSPDAREQLAVMQRDMARALIRHWKVNRALHQEYGGRIIYQQLGPEPLDAYRAFLDAQQTAGAFSIHDPALAEAFWRYFIDESIHDFMPPGSDDETQAFAVPPWGR
ncbi:META domain-containing protein [Marichromatium sp. AB32]|uniref:META domain-containing protein n=1 Tax=Marichromatium sp. AB32 TaxID=2483363 RepID=UPI0016805084|nr:META domain-containing protein [Marichromatium sp. AB32]